MNIDGGLGAATPTSLSGGLASAAAGNASLAVALIGNGVAGVLFCVLRIITDVTDPCDEEAAATGDAALAASLLGAASWPLRSTTAPSRRKMNPHPHRDGR